MRYQAVQKGRFLARPNRFIAHVELNGSVEICHVKNTGRCRELLVPGAEVWLEKGENPKRKTAWDLIAVRKGERLINMDAQAPNRVFAEFAPQFAPDLIALHSEYSYGKSRLDFCLERAAGLYFVEVKGVTLEEDGHTRFPDAPTERGIKHLHELIRAVRAGHRAAVVFIIQMEDVVDFAPNDTTHRAFGDALREAAAAGVEVLAFSCHVTPDSLAIGNPVPVIL